MPHGATPTAHILKLPLGLVGGMKLDMRHSIENEWLRAQILAAYGLPVAACQPFYMKVLAVERFDRAWWVAPQGDRRLVRLPQEDMCQAKGLPPTAKYEADGGPGIDAIFHLMNGSMTREDDRRAFFQAQVLFWMLCATDGHAKNFSLFIRPGGALSAHAAVRRALGVSGAGRRTFEDLAERGQAGHGGAGQERSLEDEGHPAQALAGARNATRRRHG